LAGSHQIQASNRIYTVVDDLSRAYRVLLKGQVRDEATGELPRTGFSVIAQLNGVKGRALEGGLFYLAGYAEQVFPDLKNSSYNVTLSVNAPGYREATSTVLVPANTTLPFDLPPVQLRPLPIRLQGRVIEDKSNRPPVENALVKIVGGPGPGEKTVSLRTPLHFNHINGTAIQGCQLNPSGTAKKLIDAAPAGQKILTLNNRTGLAANDLIYFGSDISAEYGLIESIDPLPADPNQPGRIRVRSGLYHSFAATTAVQKVIPNLAGPAIHLAREANAGDGLIILDAATNAVALRIEDALSQLVEYVALGALTDADGYFHLDGIGRVRTIELDVSATGFNPLPGPAAWTIDYKQPVNTINFRLSKP